MTLMSVCGDTLSANRILKPTASPKGTLSSDAIRDATDLAASRLGCVCPMRPLIPRPSFKHILGSCVVLPEPVSPQRITT